MALPAAAQPGLIRPGLTRLVGALVDFALPP
ncbi:MAG: hypothetical protein JWN69_2444, partial [Alphaproteobacteria bacterium]|nr:hypothetical protein [Alphaproteobacteria bacterium]